MPNDHPAFLAGEMVQFADLATLQRVQALYGVDGPQGPKWIHDILAPDMTIHAGKAFQIASVGCYHFGTIYYQFREIGKCWLEPILTEFDPDSVHQPACLDYEVTTTSGWDEPGMVQIQGTGSGIVYCLLRKNRAGREAAKIAEVSRIRSKPGFEQRYGFEGHEKNWILTP